MSYLVGLRRLRNTFPKAVAVPVHGEDGRPDLTAGTAELAAQAILLRDFLSHRFQTVAVAPARLTPAIVDLAQSIYEGRTLDRLPTLADSLEEAGCTDANRLTCECRTCVTANGLESHQNPEE